MKLPFLGQRGASGDPRGAPGAPDNATVILLVDDELAQRQLFANALRSQGYYVVEARDGADGCEQARRAGRLDLVVTDVVMPVMPGPELVARLREMYPATPALFVSGSAVPEEVANAHFLQKPFLRRDLLNRVFAVIGPPRRGGVVSG